MGNLARRSPKMGVFLHILDKSQLGHPAYNLIAMVKHLVIVIPVVPTELLGSCRADGAAAGASGTYPASGELPVRLGLGST